MKISMIMPVYYAEKYLKEVILSILRQSFSNFEFTIIDDGSTDKSLEIIKRYKQEDKRIILIS
jgi:glycosyltransferase involved in cell wall biosynthesis